MNKKDAKRILTLMKEGRREDANKILDRYGLELKPGYTLPTKKGT